jgi:putative methyltransferase (TIGR04325 family)
VHTNRWIDSRETVVKESIIKALKYIVSPRVLSAYRRLSGKGGFYGNYRTWDEASRLCSGYDSDIILNRVKEAALKVRNGDAAYEQDSVLFEKIQYSWPLLAALLWAASRNGNRLNLLDFGGSLGTSYYQNVKFLRHLNELRWNIVEQENFVKCGREYFENEHLKFFYDLDECIREHHPDAIVFSGVIQYLEKPYEVLAETMRKGFRQIIFDRTPFLEQGNDRITIQKVPADICEASYPAWFFDREKFRDFFSDQYELIAEFDTMESFNLGEMYDSHGKGFIFEKKELAGSAGKR